MLSKRRAQTTLEYALLIAVVIAALIGVQLYMRKGVMGKLKESSDDMGNQFDPSQGYTKAWQTISGGTSTTRELRTRPTGDDLFMRNTTTSIVGETVTKNEYEDFGTNPPRQHFGD